MNTRLWNIWDTLRTSYWFVPALFAIAAGMLSILAPMTDHWVNDAGWKLPDWILTTTDTGRSTLAAMAGAMMAVTGTVFSITIVTLSLASQQFGPRLLRRFMYDLPTQITLGVFLCSGFYCLFMLRAIEHHDDRLSVPHLSVLLGVLLTACGMAALIFYIHHVAMLIQAPHVVAAVAADLDESIQRLFPEKIGESPEDEQAVPEDILAVMDQLGEAVYVIRSSHDGYIQAIDGTGLLALALKYDLVLRMKAHPGNFVSIDTPLIEVWSVSTSDSTDDGSLHIRPRTWHSACIDEKELTRRGNEAIIVGPRRTPRQDVECALDELVEVAVRSLSPGINDPFTAMSCIDRLGATIGRLAERKLPSACRRDDAGRVRVLAEPVSFSCVLNSAFNQIRQYSQDSVAVTIRLLEALSSIWNHTRRPDDRQAIIRHANLVAEHAKAAFSEADQTDIRERFQLIRTDANNRPH